MRPVKFSSYFLMCDILDLRDLRPNFCNLDWSSRSQSNVDIIKVFNPYELQLSNLISFYVWVYQSANINYTTYFFTIENMSRIKE